MILFNLPNDKISINLDNMVGFRYELTSIDKALDDADIYDVQIVITMPDVSYSIVDITVMFDFLKAVGVWEPGRAYGDKEDSLSYYVKKLYEYKCAKERKE